MESLLNFAKIIWKAVSGPSSDEAYRPIENTSETYQMPRIGPYAIQMRHGKALNAIGELVSRMNPTAFIPAEEFVYQPALPGSEGLKVISKEVWIYNVVEFLKQIASKEYQLKGWVENEVHDYCTFIETSCGFFDDIHIDSFLIKGKEFGLTDIQIKKIDTAQTAFRDFADEYSGYEDPITIVNDPELAKVRRLAQEALESLGIVQYLDPSKSILKDSLLTYILWISESLLKFNIGVSGDRPRPDRFQYLMDWFFKSKVERITADYQNYEMTEDQVKILRELYKRIKVYRAKVQDEKNLQKIVDDPEWREIQALAKEVIKIFNYTEIT